MTGALLLATPGDTRWVASVAPILRDLGFEVHTDTPAPNAAADIGLVIAGAATGIPDTLLRAWRATGPVCAVVLPATAVPVPGAGEGVIACLREPVTEAQRRAYEAVDRINWPDGFCRRDIGWQAIKREQGK